MKPVIPDYEWITYGERVILVLHLQEPVYAFAKLIRRACS